MNNTKRTNSNLLIALSWIGLSWLILSCLHFGAAWLVPDGIMQSQSFPLRERLALISREILLLLPLVSMLCAPLALTAWSPRRWLRSIGTILSGALLVTVVYAYAASWYTFLSIDQFFGIEGIRMWAANPRQFNEHIAQIDPLVVIGCPLLGLASALSLLGLFHLLRRAGRGTSIFGVSICALAVCTWGWLLWEHRPPTKIPTLRAEKARAGVIYSYSDLLSSVQEKQVGPLTRIMYDLKHAAEHEPDDLLLANLEVTHPTQLTISEYLRGVDQSALKKMNVIVVLVESLRPDELQSITGKRAVMPEVDAVGRDAVIFPDTYAQSSHSNYADVCPFSSAYPLRSRYYHLYPENPPYPRVLIYDLLKAVGYRTAIISSQNENWGQMANFLTTPSLDYFLHAANYQGDTYVPHGDTGFESFVKGTKRAGKIDDRLTTNEAIAWIKKDTKTPFFLYTNMQSSHVPFEVPTDFPRKFAPATIDFRVRFGSFPKDKLQIVRDLYSDSLNYIDSQLGRLISTLKQEGLWENTMIVITGDNGQAFYEHGFAAHANELYEELVKVAFLARIPGIPASTDTRPAQHIDIPPTILNAIGLPPHPAFQGVSLLQNPPPKDHSRFLLAQAPLIHSYGIVRDGFKLLYNYRNQSYKLFDLKQDPEEKKNIANQRTDIRDDLAGRLHRWRKEQLAYYDSATLMSTTYPPKLSEDIKPSPEAVKHPG